jgi:hypothetical protein
LAEASPLSAAACEFASACLTNSASWRSHSSCSWNGCWAGSWWSASRAVPSTGLSRWKDWVGRMAHSLKQALDRIAPPTTDFLPATLGRRRDGGGVKHDSGDQQRLGFPGAVQEAPADVRVPAPIRLRGALRSRLSFLACAAEGRAATVAEEPPSWGMLMTKPPQTSPTRGGGSVAARASLERHQRRGDAGPHQESHMRRLLSQPRRSINIRPSGSREHIHQRHSSAPPASSAPASLPAGWLVPSSEAGHS